MAAPQDVRSALQRALGPAPAPPSGPPAPPAGPPAASPTPAGPAPASPAATSGAKLVGLALVLVSLVLALLVPGARANFRPAQGLVLYAGFYVAAQAVERLLEFLSPPGEGSPQAQADRVPIFGGLATLLGVGLSLGVGLRFLQAVSVTHASRWIDVFVTGLVIGGGTKPLHDLIALIEKPTK